jgi:hypothetical protein
MKEIIDNQIQINGKLNLLFKQLNTEVKIDDKFKEKLIELKNHNGNVTDLIDYTVKRTVDTIFQLNQYLDISNGEIEILKRIYQETWETLQENNFNNTIGEHHQKLSKWISKFYPPDFSEALENNRTIGSVKNREYSAEFQTAVFDISLADLKEPIIDIGCGKNGHLVNKINELKKHVVGLDRIINEEKGFLFEINWFDFYFEPKKWGTIISNMSFANHLQFTFNHDIGNIYRYYVKYKEILESLKLNGEFIYAPSLPFIEERLDRTRFSVIRKEITESDSISKIMRITE